MNDTKQNVYAYLRVSTDAQDVANQKLGVLEYCAAQGFPAPELVEDSASGKLHWHDRKLGSLIESMPAGSIFIVAEISRIGRSTLQVLEVLKAANDKGINVHVVKSKLIFDGSMQSKITSVVLGLAAEIEREFITLRTREALRVLKERGVKLGRPMKPQEVLSLDKHANEIDKLLKQKVTKRNIARIVECSPNTLYTWLERRRPEVMSKEKVEVQA